MEKVTFLSAMPYLTLSRKDEISYSIQFMAHRYTTSDPTEIQILRRDAKVNKLLIAEEGSIALDELIRLYDEAEAAAIAQAEERLKAEAEREKEKKEEHDFYSTLRAANHAYL